MLTFFFFPAQQEHKIMRATKSKIEAKGDSERERETDKKQAESGGGSKRQGWWGKDSRGRMQSRGETEKARGRRTNDGMEWMKQLNMEVYMSLYS